MGHFLGMNSRVHPKYKTKYRVNNWSEYDTALVQRGEITLWISEDAIEDWKPAASGGRGGQRKFSDHAIETALMLRLVFKLPLRQAEGFTSISKLPTTPRSRGVVRASMSNSIVWRATTPSISSSTARGCLSSAKANGLPPSMEVAAGVAGRSFISVLIERE